MSAAASDLGMTASGSGAPLADPWAMNSEQATAALAEMAKRGPAPPEKSPTGARARLVALQTDQEFLGRYFAGSENARQDLEKTLERAGSDRTERLMAGVVDPMRSDVVDGISGHEVIAENDRLRQLGVPDDVIEQGLRTDPVSKFEYDALVEYQRVLLANPDFVRSFLAGEREAVREIAIVKRGLVNGYKEGA